MKDKVVRCVYNFPAETDNDLDLRIGDVVRVTRVINADWYEGQVHNRRGQFPAAYVEDCKDLFDLAVAERTFAGEQDGDLSFQSGEYIVVTEMVDENWMRGYVQGGGYGLFPRSFVKEITLDPSEMSSVIGGIDTEAKSDGSTSGTPANEDITTEDGTAESVEPVELWIDVLETFNAMDSTELNLIAGTKVKIVSDVDDFWCRGISPSGEEGIFPRNFVDLPELKGSKTDDTHDSMSINQEAIPEGKGDGVVIEEGLDTTNKISDIKPIGRLVALFNFAGPEKGDLSFSQGTELDLLENINKEWMKGRIGEEIGIFPSNYVQVLEMFSTVCGDTTTGNTAAASSTEIQSSNRTDGPSGESTLKSSPRAVSPSTSVEPKKPPPPPKPSKPRRPKLPDSKKLSDENNLFSSDLKLKSKPLLIIPVKYQKQGTSNIVLLKNWREEELKELKHSRES